jgi:hypothetical protein
MLYVDLGRPRFINFLFGVVFCLVPFLAPSAASAAPVDINGITVTIADDGGWKKIGKGDLFMIQKIFPQTANEKQGAAIIQISKPVSGARNTLQAGLKMLVATLPDIAKEDILVKHYGVTINGYDIRVEDRCCAYVKNVSINQTVVGIASDNRQAYLQLAELNVKGDRSKAVEAEFAAVVRSLKLNPSDKDFALAPADGDGGLDGVFTHLATGLMPNAFGGMDFYSNSEIKMFDPKGLFSSELPKGGETVEDHCRNTPTDCGLYKLKGGFFGAGTIETRTVTSPYGTLEVVDRPFARNGADLAIDKGDYRAVPPFAEGTMLDGEWAYTYASSGMTAMSSGSVASRHTLTLHRNGTFERTGWSGASSTNAIGGTTTGVTVGGNQPGGNGSYKLSGYRLDLTDTSGKSETLSIFEPDKGSDGLLVINGNNYLKDDGK